MDDFTNASFILPNLNILEPTVKAKVLAATDGGQTTTAATAYDLAAQCLTEGGLFEGTAELATRCQSEALDYLARGSFPITEKAAASRVVTDLVSRVVRQESDYSLGVEDHLECGFSKPKRTGRYKQLNCGSIR